jgi:hypothetical protein
MSFISVLVDASRIKNLYIDKESVKASQELLDAVFTSEAPGKWKSFVDSLESAGKNLIIVYN